MPDFVIFIYVSGIECTATVPMLMRYVFAVKVAKNVMEVYGLCASVYQEAVFRDASVKFFSLKYSESYLW